MENSEFLDLFRNVDDDALWKITKQNIQELKLRIKANHERERMNAMYKELTHFSEEFIVTSSFTSEEKEIKITALVNFFMLEEKYRRCAKLHTILHEIKNGK